MNKYSLIFLLSAMSSMTLAQHRTGQLGEHVYIDSELDSLCYEIFENCMGLNPINQDSFSIVYRGISIVVSDIFYEDESGKKYDCILQWDNYAYYVLDGFVYQKVLLVDEKYLGYVWRFQRIFELSQPVWKKDSVETVEPGWFVLAKYSRFSKSFKCLGEHHATVHDGVLENDGCDVFLVEDIQGGNFLITLGCSKVLVSISNEKISTLRYWDANSENIFMSYLFDDNESLCCIDQMCSNRERKVMKCRIGLPVDRFNLLNNVKCFPPRLSDKCARKMRQQKKRVCCNSWMVFSTG